MILSQICIDFGSYAIDGDACGDVLENVVSNHGDDLACAI